MRVLHCVTALCATAWLAWGVAAQGYPPTPDPEILAQIDRAGAAEVFVMLREPAPGRMRDLGRRRRDVRRIREGALASFSPHDVRLRQSLSIASGFSAAVTARGLAQLLAHPDVVRVGPMRYGSGALAESVPHIHADAVHRRDDLGQGVTVALLDAGVDATHPDLSGSVIAEECFCGDNCCPNGRRRQSGAGSAFTPILHGTHVAGTIVSKGGAAPGGVAPAANIVAVKVLDDANRGWLVDWVGALEWIAEHRPDVQAINMSLASDAVFAGRCDDADAFNIAFAQVLTALRARGTLTFVAAGNNGASNALTSPACVGAAVAVGAVTSDDTVASFSNSDSSLDLLAPGVAIVSAGTGHSAGVLTGTSAAAPHATGTAALMLAMNPALAADRLEHILEDTGAPILDRRNGLTTPRLDALAALNAVLDITSPLLGGGSRRTDCLIVWSGIAAEIASRQPVAHAICRDNDPACDHDDVPGQCTFDLSICFNVADRRLPRCGTAAPIVDARLSSPSAAHPTDLFDTMNAAAISLALPALPIEEANRCTALIPFIVPCETGAGTRGIRFAASAGDGRADSDRLRLTCIPREQDVKRDVKKSPF